MCARACVCIHHIFFLSTHLLTDIYAASNSFGIVNRAEINRDVRLCGRIWAPLCMYMVNSGIPGSYGFSPFNFLRYHQTGLHNGYSSLHSHQQGIGVPVSPFLPAFVVRFLDASQDFLMAAILIRGRWCF